MKRWDITYKDNDGDVSTLKLYYKDINTIYKEFYRADSIINIEEDTDFNHFEYCNKIVELADEKLTDYRGRTVYKINKGFGYILVRLNFDTEDNIWYDFCEYQINNNKALVPSLTFTWSNPKKFCQEFLFDDLEYNLVSFRRYGEPKLEKPSILKGIKGFSVDFIQKKCACQCFIKDNDIYIKHRDYFSPVIDKPEDFGKSLNYRIEKYGLDVAKKGSFIYDDCWGSIIGRQEAWIYLKGIIPLIKMFNANQVSRMVTEKMEKYHNFPPYSLDLEWERFYENVCKKVDYILSEMEDTNNDKREISNFNF